MKKVLDQMKITFLKQFLHYLSLKTCNMFTGYVYIGKFINHLTDKIKPIRDLFKSDNFFCQRFEIFLLGERFSHPHTDHKPLIPLI